jgi:hypothetical protein
MQSTITIDEANVRVEDYISRALKVLPAEVKPELSFEERSGECSDPTDNGPQGRVVAGRSYKLLGLQTAAIPSYFDTLRSWWQANNFRILSDTPKNEFLWVENNADSFQMTLKANSVGGIYLLAGSPCVWPNGTPEPQAAAEQPAHEPAVAQDQSAVAPVASKSAQARRHRRAPAEDAEDFDQTDWTSES